MKKWIAFVLAFACALGLVGCRESMDDIIASKTSVTGIVEEVHDDFVILFSDTTEMYPYHSRWKVPLDVEYKDSYTDISVGDEVVVYHDGSVTESDPLQIGYVYAITLKTPADRETNEKT